MSLLLGTADGLYLSQKSQTRKVFDAPDVHDLHEGSSYTYASTANGVLRSVNKGETWTKSGLSDFEVWVVRQASNETLYAGTNPAGLFKSVDQGDTWEEVEPLRDVPGFDDWCFPLTPPQPARARGLLIDPDNDERIWVGVEVGGLARTSDGGAYTRPMCFDHRAPHALTIATAPNARSSFEDEHGAQSMLYQTIDSGDHWYSLCDQQHSPSRERIHGLTIDPDNLGGVFAGTDAGNVWRIAKPNDWELVCEGLPCILSLQVCTTQG